MTRSRFFIIFVLALVLNASAFAAEILREIRVNGAQRIEPATILTYLNIPTGQPLTEDVLNEGLKNLFAASKFFRTSIGIFIEIPLILESKSK